jgi:hypothetical protein
VTPPKETRARGARPEPETFVTEEERARIGAIGKREFQELLSQLARDFTSDPGNPGSYACEGCSRCANCMFCRGCESCYHCTHCVRSELCNNCTHCVESKSCLSQNLSDCNYCLGCVGLSKKDFYILNVAFSRTEYFKAFNRLKKELGLP